MLRRAEQMLLEASGEVKSKRCEIRVCTVRFLVLRYKKLKNDVYVTKNLKTTFTLQKNLKTTSTS